MFLAIPILYDHCIHGKLNKNINGHYICYTIISSDMFYKNEYKEYIQLINQNIKRSVNVELVELKRLETGEDICLIKTHLIKQIQRKWRKIYYAKN